MGSFQSRFVLLLTNFSLLFIFFCPSDKGGDPEIIRESQRRRYSDVGLVDKVLDLDQQWRKARGDLDTLNMDFNSLNNEIKKLRIVSKATKTSINTYFNIPLSLCLQTFIARQQFH